MLMCHQTKESRYVCVCVCVYLCVRIWGSAEKFMSDQGTLMEYNQMRFIFQYSPPYGPLTCSVSVAVLGSY